MSVLSFVCRSEQICTAVISCRASLAPLMRQIVSVLLSELLRALMQPS
jgi:hypothetical protein